MKNKIIIVSGDQNSINSEILAKSTAYKKKAIIISIKGYKLSKKEKSLLANERPWGLILFKRNIKSLKQIKKLIKRIRQLTKDSKFPIIIDEEGVKVSRLNKIAENNFSQKHQLNRKLQIQKSLLHPIIPLPL